MKYRQMRIGYGFNGRLQDDLEAYQGFMEIAREEGWRVVAIYEQFERRVRALLNAGALDAVVGKFISRSWLDGLPGRPLAVHLGESELAGVPSVLPDTRRVGRQAAEHLSEKGYDVLAWFSPRRVAEIRAGMREVSGGDPVEHRTPQSLRAWLSPLPDDTVAGVFCLTDFHARQAIRTCRDLGLQLPERVGVMGIGDRFWDGVAAGIEISSMPIPHRRMGEAAADVLRQMMDGTVPAPVRIPPGEVRVRASTRRSGAGGRLLDLAREAWVGALDDPVSVADLARRAGMSRRGFERAFAAEAGATPYEYLLRMRTDAALRLLRETEWTVGRIGAEVGIPDPARFSAFMRKRTGKAPSGLR